MRKKKRREKRERYIGLPQKRQIYFRKSVGYFNDA